MLPLRRLCLCLCHSLCLCLCLCLCLPLSLPFPILCRCLSPTLRLFCRCRCCVFCACTIGSILDLKSHSHPPANHLVNCLQRCFRWYCVCWYPPSTHIHTFPPTAMLSLVVTDGVGWRAYVWQALVKKFTRQTVKDLKGPVTVVMGKKRRVTFIECPNDLNSMIVSQINDAPSLLVAS
jgi:hypothetical protein